MAQILRNTASREKPGALDIVELDRRFSVMASEDAVLARETAHEALSGIARLPARQRDALVGTAINGRSRTERRQGHIRRRPCS